MEVLRTPKFRVSFPSVFEKGGPPGTPEEKLKYSITMLFTMEEINADPAQKALWDQLIASAQACAIEKWGDKIPATLASPFRKGEEKEQFAGYGEGVMFMNAKTTTRPGVVDQRVVRIIDPEDFYAGCYAHADINPFAWTYMGKSGISFGLQNVQKVGDGEPLGGRTSAESSFDAVDAEVEKSTSDAGNGASLFN